MGTITCFICGNEGEHDSAAHYIADPGKQGRPAMVMAMLDRLEALHGTRPSLAEVMELLGLHEKAAR